jgi:hypothetical protein
MEKALFGERVSDDYMLAQGHTSLLPLDRTPVDNLIAKSQGAYKLDGVYKNAHPPKDYIITEAKYRKSGEFSAGNLPTTKGSTRGVHFVVDQRINKDTGARAALPGAYVRFQALPGKLLIQRGDLIRHGFQIIKGHNPYAVVQYPVSPAPGLMHSCQGKHTFRRGGRQGVIFRRNPALPDKCPVLRDAQPVITRQGLIVADNNA